MGSEVLFHTISITHVKGHSDNIILQKQIKQQIDICMLEFCYANNKNRSQIKMEVKKQKHVTL